MGSSPGRVKTKTIKLVFGTKDQQQKLEKVQRREARYVHNNHDYTSSTTAMINTLQWPTLAERRLKTRLVLFYKIVHCLVAIPSHILVLTDSRTTKDTTGNIPV
jgi:hypothetical protein